MRDSFHLKTLVESETKKWNETHRKETMKTSDAGVALVQKWESCRLRAYLDIRGIPTIGWGHTGNDFKMGDNWTQEQCDMILLRDLEEAENAVNQFVTALINQSQFDALVSFTFNLGRGALYHSTLLTKLNSGDTEGAANEFRKWDHAEHKEVPGLLARREDEQAMFIS